MYNEQKVTYDIFKNRFGQTAETQLAYNIIFNSLLKIEPYLRQSYQLNLVRESADQIYFMDCAVGKISRKMYFNLINKNEIISICKEWRDRYQINKETSDVWIMSHKCCSEVKLRQLQWKILHKIYPTNALLFKMKIKDKEECDFCNEKDDLTHFFASCPVSKKVWCEAEKKISCYLGNVFKLCEKIIIIGLMSSENLSNKDIYYINKICLIGKMTISKYKFHKTGNIALTFENELRMRGLN